MKEAQLAEGSPGAPTLFDRLAVMCAVVCLLVFVLLPMLVISHYGGEPTLGGMEGPAETTVGIAVILRVTARRLLRTGTRNLLRTTFGTFSRTTSRAVMRRSVRVAVKSLALAGKEAVSDQAEGSEDAPQNPVIAVAVGFVALFASLWVILRYVVSAASQAAILQGTSPELAAFLGALPIIVYALLVHVAGRRWNVEIEYQTGADGLLLQAYFTGAGSFLPLTTDTYYRGNPDDARRVALTALVGLFGTHVLLATLAVWRDSYTIQLAAAMFLIYVFVFSFPIKPLDGNYLWQKSKLLWLAVFLPVLIAFFRNIPESFNGML